VLGIVTRTLLEKSEAILNSHPFRETSIVQTASWCGSPLGSGHLWRQAVSARLRRWTLTPAQFSRLARRRPTQSCCSQSLTTVAQKP